MESIVKAFSGVRVLHSVDFEVLSGEVMALVGENGAGKSTLMKIAAGVHTDWEVPNMIAKYHTTTTAVGMIGGR